MDKKELEQSHASSFHKPPQQANIYDNTTLFKRETIESRIEGNPIFSAAAAGPP